MRGMDTNKRTAVFPESTQVRYHPETMACRERVIANLRSRRKIKFLGKRITREALENAIWIWLEETPLDELEVILEKYVPRVEGVVQGTGLVVQVRPPQPAAKPAVVRVVSRSEASRLDQTGAGKRKNGKRRAE